MMRGGAACAGGAAAGSTVCQAPRRGGARSSASAVFVFGRRERLYVAAACVCAGPAGPCPACRLPAWPGAPRQRLRLRPSLALPAACLLGLGRHRGACAAAAVAAAGAAGRRLCDVATPACARILHARARAHDPHSARTAHTAMAAASLVVADMRPVPGGEHRPRTRFVSRAAHPCSMC